MEHVHQFPVVDAGNNVHRRVLAESPQLMMVEVAFAANGIGTRTATRTCRRRS